MLRVSSHQGRRPTVFAFIAASAILLLAGRSPAAVQPAPAPEHLPGIDDLDESARAQFEELRPQLTTVQREIDDLVEQLDAADPLLDQAREGRDEMSARVRESREQLAADVREYVAGGRGEASLMEHWQSRYGKFVMGAEVFQALIADPELRPYYVWIARETVDRLAEGGAIPRDLQAVADLIPEDAGAIDVDEMLTLMSLARSRAVEDVRGDLQEIEQEVQPTPAEREHVRTYERDFAVEALYTLYVDATATQAAPDVRELSAHLSELRDEERGLVNRLTSAWPTWRDAEEQARELLRRRQAEAALNRNQRPSMRLILWNLALLGVIATFLIWSRKRAGHREARQE